MSPKPPLSCTGMAYPCISNVLALSRVQALTIWASCSSVLSKSGFHFEVLEKGYNLDDYPSGSGLLSGYRDGVGSILAMGRRFFLFFKGCWPSRRGRTCDLGLGCTPRPECSQHIACDM